MFLSVIIPAYNEEKRISKILDAAYNYFQSKDFDYEIIVVDDGSKDKTDKVAQNYSSKFKNLKILSFLKNSGKGAAVKAGVLESKGDYLLFADADNSTSFEQVEFFLKYMSEFDIIIGSRALKDSQLVKRQNFFKTFLGRAGNFIICRLFKIKIKDTQCGFKLFSKKAGKEIFSKQTINGWGFDIEVLVIASKLGYNIKEVGVKWLNDMDSKVRWTSYLKVLKELWKIKKEIKKIN